MPWTWIHWDGNLRVGSIARRNVEHPDDWMIPLRDQFNEVVELQVSEKPTRNRVGVDELSMSAAELTMPA
jgi:hypothetical protein